MLISRKILQTYFADPLPESSVIARELTMKSYEVEGVEKVGNDEIFNIDVLPNRASDSLSHMGVARELGMVLSMETNLSSEKVALEEKKPETIDISIEPGTAKRFIAVAITGLEGSKETPIKIKEVLEALGERSIGPIVDITNYVMLVSGQPLHAYDLDVIESITGKAALSVIRAEKNETLTLLDGTETVMSGEELLIKTKDRPLGLAGVKGGLESSVTAKTTRILLEAATFDPKLVRRTSKLSKTYTGASKRFENSVPSELAAVGIDIAITLLNEVYGGVTVEALRDLYPSPEEPAKIELRKNQPKDLLGIEIDEGEMVQILQRVGAEVEVSSDNFKVAVPWFRPDLKLPVDLIEEIGRLYGLDNITSSEMSPKAVTPERSSVAREVVRDLLAHLGFSEIITRAFHKQGKVELANPLATDTPFLRASMVPDIQKSLNLASQNAELLEIDHARVFEVGTVFNEDGEHVHLVVGIQKTKNSRIKLNLEDQIKTVEKELGAVLGVDFYKYRTESQTDSTSFIAEYNLDKLISDIDLMPHWEYKEPEFKHYQEFSAFPYILRDVAVWTPEGTTATDIEKIILANTSDLLRVLTLFDRFEKKVDEEVRISYAFRLVFQSFEKTLSDEEVNKEMDLVYSALSKKEGFEIR